MLWQDRLITWSSTLLDYQGAISFHFLCCKICVFIDTLTQLQTTNKHGISKVATDECLGSVMCMVKCTLFTTKTPWVISLSSRIKLYVLWLDRPITDGVSTSFYATKTSVATWYRYYRLYLIVLWGYVIVYKATNLIISIDRSKLLFLFTPIEFAP